MSTEKQAAPALPDPQTAVNNLLGVVNWAFFQKCAQHGIQPRNQEEADKMLKIAENAAAVLQQDREKAAAAGSDPLSRLLAASEALAEHHQVKSAGDVAKEQGAQAFASQLMADPTIFNSVLSVKSAEADEAMEQVRQWQATHATGS